MLDIIEPRRTVLTNSSSTNVSLWDSSVFQGIWSKDEKSEAKPSKVRMEGGDCSKTGFPPPIVKACPADWAMGGVGRNWNGTLTAVGEESGKMALRVGS